VSSISGSDSDNQDDYQNQSDDESDYLSENEDDSKNDLFQIKMRSQPKIAFKLSDSNVLVMHRCLLHGKKVFYKKKKKTLKNNLISVKSNRQIQIILKMLSKLLNQFQIKINGV
jgi:hypothetical protein